MKHTIKMSIYPENNAIKIAMTMCTDNNKKKPVNFYNALMNAKKMVTGHHNGYWKNQDVVDMMRVLENLPLEPQLKKVIFSHEAGTRESLCFTTIETVEVLTPEGGVISSEILSKNSKEGHSYTAIYTLSATPHLALYFIACLTGYLSYLTPQIPIDLDNGVTQQHFFNISHATPYMLMDELCKIPLPQYQTAFTQFQRIKTIYARIPDYRKNINSFYELLGTYEYLEMHGINSSKLSKKLSDNQIIANLNFTQPEEGAYLQRLVSKVLLIPLLTRCIDQIAHDKGQYSWHYTEIHALHHATWSLRDDGHIQIDVSQSAIYLNYYVTQNKLSQLQDELIFLMPLLGLKIQSNNTLPEQITLTAKSTQQLIQLGLFTEWEKRVAPPGAISVSTLSMFRPENELKFCNKNFTLPTTRVTVAYG